jgi:hypothetical protein
MLSPPKKHKWVTNILAYVMEEHRSHPRDVWVNMDT